jgi:hypothetical protein
MRDHGGFASPGVPPYAFARLIGVGERILQDASRGCTREVHGSFVLFKAPL